jgi:hypothetical protein
MWALALALLVSRVGDGRVTVAVEHEYAQAPRPLSPPPAVAAFVRLPHEVLIKQGTINPEFGAAAPKRRKLVIRQINPKIDLYLGGVFPRFRSYDRVGIQARVLHIDGLSGDRSGNGEADGDGRQKSGCSPVISERNVTNDGMLTRQSIVDGAAIWPATGKAWRQWFGDCNQFNSHGASVYDGQFKANHGARHGHGSIGTSFCFGHCVLGRIKGELEEHQSRTAYEDGRSGRNQAPQAEKRLSLRCLGVPQRDNAVLALLIVLAVATVCLIFCGVWLVGALDRSLIGILLLSSCRVVGCCRSHCLALARVPLRC